MRQKKVIVALIVILSVLLVVLTAGTLAGLWYADSYERHMERARGYQAAMEYKAAAEEYERSIQKAPEEKEAYLELAQMYIGLGEYEEAAAVLQDGYERTGKSSFEKKLAEVGELLAGRQDEGSPAKEGQTDREQQGEREKDAPALVPSGQRLQAYLDQELMAEKKEFDWKAVHKTGYTQSSAGSLTDVSGIVHTDIKDYDMDGQAELLVLLMEDAVPIWQMYEETDGQVALAAETEAACGKIGHVDLLEYRFYEKDGAEAPYLAENGRGTVCVLADGVDETIRVLRYTGSGFEEMVMQEFMGSDFSGMEPEIGRTAEKLRACGFTESADELTETLELRREDGMELIFMIKGTNDMLYDPGDMYQMYSETGDVSALGEVAFAFYPSDEAYRADHQIQGYTVQKDDYSVSEGGMTVSAFFERAVFEGNGSAPVDWLNARVEELAASYREEVSDLDETLEMMEGYAESYETAEMEWYHDPHTLVSVYYDEDGNVSIGYSWEWYLGGVFNSGWEVLNCQIADRSSLTIYDALGTDWSEGDQMIEDAMRKEGWDEALIARAREVGLEGYRFYFDEDTVYLCFNSYDLGQGPGSSQIEIPR